MCPDLVCIQSFMPRYRNACHAIHELIKVALEGRAVCCSSCSLLFCIQCSSKTKEFIEHSYIIHDIMSF